MIEKKAIMESLQSVPDVSGKGNIVSSGRVSNISVDEKVIKLTLALPTEDHETRIRIEDECRRAISAIVETSDMMVMIRVDTPADSKPKDEEAASPFDAQAPIPGVQNIIAIASGKGGVGKSTVCVNLALALKKHGFRVGLMDADVYGPSLHVLMGIEGGLTPGQEKEVAAVDKDGMKMMSLGFLTGRSTPVIWRGPIVQGVIKQFLVDVEWGELDYLLIDLPPGTGDTQLTLVQTVPITSAIIVTTPSEIALVDAEKGLNMFTEVNVPVLGIVENMSYFVCPHCSKQTDVFDAGGGKRISKKLSVEFLGEVPLDSHVREGGDRGEPIVLSDPESSIAKSFFALADRVAARCPAKKA
jgi:ATP-binding protein involved in chromosome partitioning